MIRKMDGELAWLNWASLYRLFEFYRVYVPDFANLVELLHQLLSEDTQPWAHVVGECACKVG